MSDNTQLFIDEVMGKQIDVDHFPPDQPFQCKDVVQKYVTECLALPPLPQGNAGLMFALAPADKYIKIRNTWWAKPQEGDIIVWSTAMNGYGHIAIKDKTPASIWNFTSCDQNWSAPRVTTEKHNYRFVIGWLRKK